MSCPGCHLQMHTLEDLVEQRTQALRQASLALQHEIDERKQLESQLVQSEKLASLGQLAAGVAHEINNPIGFIGSNLGTLDGYFNQPREMLDAYRSAEEGIASVELLGRPRALRDKIELDFLKEDIPLLIKESKDGEDLRPVLHHQTGRTRHRAGLVAVLWDCPEACRADFGHQ